MYSTHIKILFLTYDTFDKSKKSFVCDRPLLIKDCTINVTNMVLKKYYFQSSKI